MFSTITIQINITIPWILVPCPAVLSIFVHKFIECISIKPGSISSKYVLFEKPMCIFIWIEGLMDKLKRLLQLYIFTNRKFFQNKFYQYWSWYQIDDISKLINIWGGNLALDFWLLVALVVRVVKENLSCSKFVIFYLFTF